MWKTTNYKGETVIWYSEEEYNELEQKYIQALRKIGTLIKDKKDEGNNTRNSNVSNNANQYTMDS